MTVLTNPPFSLCRNKKYLLEMQSKKDAVILATFRFCNKLGNIDIIDLYDWPEIASSQALAIYSSYEEKNSIEKPDFYEKWLHEYDEKYKDYIASHNVRYFVITRKNGFLNPKFNELTPESFIVQRANKYRKKGDKVRRKIYPKNVREIYEKYKEQIVSDTYLWSTAFDMSLKIRKEFFDEENLTDF